MGTFAVYFVTTLLPYHPHKQLHILNQSQMQKKISETLFKHSQYMLAIGLRCLALQESLPHTLSCTPKQLDF